MDPQNSAPPVNNPKNNLPNQGPVPPAPNQPTAEQSVNYIPPGTIEPLEPGSLTPQSESPASAPQSVVSQLPPVESPVGVTTEPSGQQNPQVVVPPAIEKPKSKKGLIIGIVAAVVVIPVVSILLLTIVLTV